MSKKALSDEASEQQNEALQQNLYDLKELRKAVKEVQSTKRFEHTKGVEYTSAALAMRYGASMEDALVAGLLHDCAKCLSGGGLSCRA